MAERLSMRAWLAGGLLAMAGLIHLLPLPGLLGAGMLGRLYGITVDDAGLELLLRHRALLFGLLGGGLLLATFRPALRPPMITAGLLSCGGFLLLAGDPRLLDPTLQRVWTADLLALSGLLGAAALGRVAAIPGSVPGA
jgi:hypothetical protein